jgi:hypothetical protein
MKTAEFAFIPPLDGSLLIADGREEWFFTFFHIFLLQIFY